MFRSNVRFWFDGTVGLLRGNHDVLEGPSIEGCAILRFPSMEEARRWYDSPKYQEARKHRPERRRI